VTRRLTLIASSVLVVVLVVFTVVRGLVVADTTDRVAQEGLAGEALAIGVALTRPTAALQPDAATLQPYATADRRIRVTLPSGAEITAGMRPAGHAVSGVATVDGVRVEVRAPATAVGAPGSVWTSLGLLALTLAALGALALVAAFRRVTAPVHALAAASDSLVRGRLDLRLPTSSVPELAAIGEGLATSARRQRDALHRERDLALRASHELRTPLTALSLDLDALVDHPALTDDLRHDVGRCRARVGQIDTAVGEVLREVRTHLVAPESEVPLADLAAAAARAWAATLAPVGTEVEVALAGDPTVGVTAGPFEQLLDDLLLAVRPGAPTTLRLTLTGAAEHVGVGVEQVGGDGSPIVAPASVQQLVETLGGRLAARGDDLLAITLPRR